MSVASSRPRRDESRAYAYDDYDKYDDLPRRTSRSSTDRSSSNKHHQQGQGKHKDCKEGTCTAIEKEYGGFGWSEGITLAVIGGLALFNFDKAYEKHKARSERKEEMEKQGEQKRSRSSPRQDRLEDRTRDRRRSYEDGNYGGEDYDDFYGEDPYRHQRDTRRDKRRERYRASQDPYSYAAQDQYRRGSRRSYEY